MSETEVALRAWDAAARITDAARTTHYFVLHATDAEAQVTFDIYRASVDAEREAFATYIEVERREKST